MFIIDFISFCATVICLGRIRNISLEQMRDLDTIKENVRNKIDQTNSIQLSLQIIVCVCASLSLPNLLLIVGMMVVHNCGKMKQDVIYSQPSF